MGLATEQLLWVKNFNAKLTGKDISQESVNFANHLYSQDNCDFVVKDIMLDKAVEEFDFVVSFETLEHIDFTEEYFDTVCKKLKPGGSLILSVPDRRSNLDAGYKNKFHVNEMYIEHLLKYLKKYFNDVQIAFQVQRPASKVRR